MRIHNWIHRRVLVVGLMGTIGLVEGRLERAISAESPLQKSEVAVAAFEGPQGDPSKKDDSGRASENQARGIVDRRGPSLQGGDGAVEVRSIGSGSSVCVSADGFFVTNHHVVAGAGLGEKVRLVVDPGQKSQRIIEAQDHQTRRRE